MEPAEKVPGGVLDRRPEPVARCPRFVAEPPVERVGYVITIDGSASVDVSLHSGVRVECDHQLEVSSVKYRSVIRSVSR
jgi:hypothetical protein